MSSLGRSLFLIAMAVMMAVSSVAPVLPAKAASGNMQITPIDFGDAGVWGDSTMLSSGGKNLLMDTYIRDKYDTLINYLDDHHFYNFDIYLSHYHYDHMDQIPAIIEDSRFHVGTVYLPDPAYVKRGAQSTSYCKDFLNGYNNIVNTANENGCKIVYLKKGSTFKVGEATVKVLWGCTYNSNSYDASYINNNSLVTKVTAGTVSYLTCGDIESEVENQIVASGIDISADIFKFNHHGGNSSNTAAFVKKVNPSFAYYNWLGDSPSSFGGGWVQTPINNLKNTCNIYSTRYNGMLTFTVKAGHISVAGERNMRTVTANIKDSSGNIVNTVSYQFNDALDYHITAKMKATAATVSADNSTTALPARYSYTARFVETSGGVKYRNKDGSYSTNKFQTIDGDTYYFNANGYRLTGWKKIGGKLYYFDSQGKMYLRWKRVNGKKFLFDPVDGHMHTGWEWVAEKNAWYYLSPKYGYLLEGWKSIGGKLYYLTPGEFYAKTGWQTFSGKRFYFDPQKAFMYTGWQTIGGKKYYFGTNGVMVTGKQIIDGRTYVFNGSGVLTSSSAGTATASATTTTTSGTTAGTTTGGKTGSTTTDTTTGSKTGSTTADTTTGSKTGSTTANTTTGGTTPSKTSGSTSSGTSSSLQATGNKTGWVKVGDGYKYQKGTTYVANQMLTISGETYYFDSNGYRVTGFKSIGGKTYYFDGSGKRLYRWKRINNKKYYFDPIDGHMHTGWEWVEENDAWYYLSTKYGYLLEGWISVGGKMYYLTPNDFYAKTGWQTISGRKYYFHPTDAYMYTGWQTIGGKKYYFGTNGVMVTGTQTINGQVCTFNSSGVLVSGSAVGSTTSTATTTSTKTIWNSSPYVTSAVTNTWAKSTDIDMPFDVTTKRNAAFVNNMLAYATYFVGKMDYASSVTNNDPNGLRFRRLISGGKTDCSWFVYHVLYKYGLAGEEFIHSYQWGNDPSTYPGGVNIGTDISKASPGDIICTGKGTQSSNSHVMIYLGGGKVVECAAGYGVILSNAPSSCRQIVHFSCLPNNPGADYTKSTTGTWVKSGTDYKFKVGSSYLTNCFQNIDGDIYYFNANGVRLTGWKKIGGKMYYFTSDGKMYLRWKRINGKKYYFDPISGYMHTGWEWVAENNAWYYLDPSSGALVTGWQTIDGKKYYFDSGNKMVTGTRTIDGKSYTFGSDGVLK